MSENNFIEIQIEKMGNMAEGIGYSSERKPIFVERTLPGDIVRAKIFEEEKRYAYAELIEVVKPSIERRESPCAYFQSCGGCDFLNWNYDKQLSYKDALLKHTFSRFSLPVKTWLPILGAEKTTHYRNRIQVRAENGRVGFYKKKTQNIVDIESCLMADEKINEALKEVRKESFSEKTKIELYLKADGTVGKSINQEHAVTGFGQIHEEQNKRLKAVVADFIAQSGSKKILELYAGNGNLTFAFAGSVEKVLALDFHSGLIEEGKKLAEEKGLANVQFAAGNVDNPTLPHRVKSMLADYDTLLLDPPRAGIGKYIQNFISDELKTIIYVSCSAQSFSHDAQAIKKYFDLEAVQPIDMFPNTKHIELVGMFRKKNS